jgi:hypothetical protein
MACGTKRRGHVVADFFRFGVESFGNVTQHITLRPDPHIFVALFYQKGLYLFW